jgi:hypothetical protein
MRSGLALGLLCLLVSSAAAGPPPLEVARRERPVIEWSTWFRLGFGREAQPATEAIPRMLEAAPIESATVWSAALGAEASVGMDRDGDLRFGIWSELRGLELFSGVELVLTRVPERIDMFLYDGQGILMVRGGGNPDRGTAALAYGYLAPWKLWGPWTGPTRYMIGARFVATYTRAWNDPRDWSATFGIEAEPAGALRYLLGIRSWY